MLRLIRVLLVHSSTVHPADSITINVRNKFLTFYYRSNRRLHKKRPSGKPTSQLCLVNISEEALHFTWQWSFNYCHRSKGSRVIMGIEPTVVYVGAASQVVWNLELSILSTHDCKFKSITEFASLKYDTNLLGHNYFDFDSTRCSTFLTVKPVTYPGDHAIE